MDSDKETRNGGTAVADYPQDFEECFNMDMDRLGSHIKRWITECEPLSKATDIPSYMKDKFYAQICVKGRLCDKLKKGDITEGALASVGLVFALAGWAAMIPFAMFAAWIVKYGLKKFCNC
jgi:hypothetical protein